MLKIKNGSEFRLAERRDFITRTATLTGMAILGASVAAMPAFGLSTGSLAGASALQKSLRLDNVTADDFSLLVGQTFHLQMEDGSILAARLIESQTPSTRRALRFRREHFSLVFDVTGDQQLTQSKYWLSHPQIGTLDIFMVPVDLPGKHRRLEAIFS